MMNRHDLPRRPPVEVVNGGGSRERDGIPPHPMRPRLVAEDEGRNNVERDRRGVLIRVDGDDVVEHPNHRNLGDVNGRRTPS